MTIDIGRLYSVTNSERQLSNSGKLNKQFYNNNKDELTVICSNLFLNLHRYLDKTTFKDNDCNILENMFAKCISGDELNL